MQLIDPYHPLFMSYWRRVILVSVVIGWGLFEFYTGAAFWGMLFGGAGLYCGYVFIANPIGRAPDRKPDKGDGTEGN